MLYQTEPLPEDSGGTIAGGAGGCNYWVVKVAVRERAAPLSVPSTRIV